MFETLIIIGYTLFIYMLTSSPGLIFSLRHMKQIRKCQWLLINFFAPYAVWFIVIMVYQMHKGMLNFVIEPIILGIIWNPVVFGYAIILEKKIANSFVRKYICLGVMLSVAVIVFWFLPEYPENL